jgi:peptidoglycan/xylan/chitin deacetylase (PgdA/CDA1 family)
MRNVILKILQLISRLIPFGLYPRLVRRDLISIFYHAVSDGALAHVRHLYPVVPVADFEAALVYLQENYTFVSYDQLHAHYFEGVPLPPKALHLSFDDGFGECFSVVRPILLARKIPCTFFLTTDWVENRMLYFRHLISLCVHQAQKLSAEAQGPILEAINQRVGLSLGDLAGFNSWLTAFRSPDAEVLAEVTRLLGIDIPAYLAAEQPYLTRTQIKQMRAEGFTIGAHSLSHRKLGFIPEEELETEINSSCRGIQEISGQEVVPFSFPQSAGNVDRAKLGDLLAGNPSIGLLFDTKDLRKDVGFIVNRVWAERPLTAARVLHPLPEILAQAYRDAWVHEFLGRLRGRRG